MCFLLQPVDCACRLWAAHGKSSDLFHGPIHFFWPIKQIWGTLRVQQPEAFPFASLERNTPGDPLGGKALKPKGSLYTFLPLGRLAWRNSGILMHF